jgi:hydroxymethylglutaryl-CoA lyase
MGLFESLPDRVSVYEVSPRDGLQNEAALVPTPRKADLVRALIAAGLTRIEVGSFVSPRWIPQLADAEALLSLLPVAAAQYSALCPNMQGLERARATSIHELGIFVSASETHNKRNLNGTIDKTLSRIAEVASAAAAHGIRVRGYISALWGCPYEGDVDPARGLAIARKLAAMGCYEISLGDTLGVGNPRQTRDILRLFLQEFSAELLALHMHDTRGTALANVVVGLELGIRTFDAAVGGLGGCPYAPGAAGNLATEDLVYMLHGMGIPTGIDLDKLWEAGKVAAAVVGHDLSGKVHKAGVRSAKPPDR